MIKYRNAVIFLMLMAMGTAYAQTATPDAVIKLIRHNYTVKSDGTMDINIRKEIKLLRNRAITAYALNGETFVEYNPVFESLDINECYTLTADGKKVEPRPSAFIPQLPASCADCGRLNDIREMAIIHTGLEPNCTVVLDYTLHRRSSSYFATINMRQRYPVERFEIIVNGKMLREATNIEQDDWAMQAGAPTRDDMTVSIALGSLPQYKGETFLQAAENLSAVKEGKTPMEKVESICRWISGQVLVRHGLDLARLDYQLAPAEEVYLSNCGTPADVTGLAVALFNQAGVIASLVRDTNVKDISESFRAEVKIDGVVYRLNPLNKAGEPEPEGVAKEAVVDIEVDTNLVYGESSAQALKVDALADGYGRITLPTVAGATVINTTVLTDSRSAPFVTTPCEEKYHYTVKLPKKARLMGGDINVNSREEGIGSVEVKVTQNGRKLDITRRLVIETNQVAPERCRDLREMMAVWNNTKSMIIVLP